MARNFLEILWDCIAAIDGKSLIFLLLGAFVLGILCWWICSSYTKLWNKNFKIKLSHHLLCAISMLLSIIFIICFYAVKNITSIACEDIEKWHNNIIYDDEWSDNTYEKAFYAVEEINPDIFIGVPKPGELNSYIPLSTDEEQIVCAETYIDESYKDFFSNYPFFGGILRRHGKDFTAIIADDLAKYFATYEDAYPEERAIDLAADNIQEDLTFQAPRIAKITRIILVALFLLVQLIPFGLIGYCAYKDLKIKQLYNT